MCRPHRLSPEGKPVFHCVGVCNSQRRVTSSGFPQRPNKYFNIQNHCQRPHLGRTAPQPAVFLRDFPGCLELVAAEGILYFVLSALVISYIEILKISVFPVDDSISAMETWHRCWLARWCARCVTCDANSNNVGFYANLMLLP
jgi:hypothetical protein